jgi:thiosulfate/3-mercaptopyruvate sulfurtransferase
MEPLVSTAWLAEHLEAPDIRIVDASWYLPGVERDAKAEYAECHIPAAVYFDIDDIADADNPLPHMLPAPEKFSSRVRKLGLGDGVRIVVYDSGSWMASARVWWMFRVFGHDDVAVLDGGLAKWRAEGRPLDNHPILPRERHFTARMNTFLVRDVGQMLGNVKSGRAQVLDARAAGRFDATVPEPRAGLRGGHIPGSLNLPYDRLIDADSGEMLPADALAAVFDAAEVDRSRPVITSCGSGVSAGVLALALAVIGHPDGAVYDGSWTEWGGRDDTPIEP